MASWASGKEMKELKDSMDTIRLTAADFLEKLEAAVAERSAERVTVMQYAEKLIADKGQGITIFDDEQRNLIVNFAFKLDDRAATEELVNGLAAALAEDDKEEANRLMYDGCVNNVPKKPRRIGGRWSVLDRLHIKQAERRQKDNALQQEQERSRKN